MTVKSQTAPNRKNQSESAQERSTPRALKVESRLKLRDWILLPLGAMAFMCVYTFVTHGWPTSFFIEDPLLGILAQPTFMALLMTPFLVFYIYKVIRRQPTPLLADISAYIFAPLFIIALILASISGSEGMHFKLAILLFNPFVGVVLLVAAVVGVISLFAGHLSHFRNKDGQ